MKLTFECRFYDEVSKPYLLALQVKEGESMDKEGLLLKAVEQLSHQPEMKSRTKSYIKELTLIGVSSG